MSESFLALTSFGSACWSFRSPGLACLLAQCNLENGFRRRVVLDPEGGVVSLMSTAPTHGFHAGALTGVMGRLLDTLHIPHSPMGASRWRHPDDAQTTGVVADASFYLAEQAAECVAACRGKSADAMDAFCLAHPPQLVIEVGAAPGVDTLPLYRQRGIREVWRLENTVPDGPVVLTASFHAPLSDDGVTAIPVSQVLPGITPTVFTEAVAAATSSAMGSERHAAVDEVIERHGVGGGSQHQPERLA